MSIKKELSRVINTYSYDTLLNMSDDDIADYIIESLKDLSVFSAELERNSLELARRRFFDLRSEKTIKKRLDKSAELERNYLELARRRFFDLRSEKTIKKRLDEIKADEKNTIAKPLKQETNKKEEDMFNNTLNTNDTDSY